MDEGSIDKHRNVPELYSRDKDDNFIPTGYEDEDE
jgi:hypothetical protein